MLILLPMTALYKFFYVPALALVLIYKHENFRRIDAILDSGEFLEVCKTLFKIIDFKIYAYIRIIK